MKKFIIRLLPCLLLLSMLCACNESDLQADDPTQTPGVSANEILIGSSLPLSGHAKYLGIQTLRGALSYINWVNDNGGIYGRKIRVIALDDAYDPPRCVINTQKLIIEDNVFALFCYVGTPTTVKIMPLIDQARIPLIGMFTGANALRTPFRPYIINVRASYYQETAEVVKHLVEDLGLDRIAVFYQYDAYGFDGLSGTELALQRYGLTPVARGTYIRGTMDIEEGLNKIIDSNAQAVVMIGTYDPCAKFIREARARNFDPLFYNVSFVGAEELARRLRGEEDATVVLSQVVPPPSALEELPHTNDPGYIALLKDSFPQDVPNFIGLEGFFNAKILVEGLRKAGRDLTRTRFINAIESIQDYPLAKSLSASFSPSDHQGLDRVYFTRFTNGGFQVFGDWDEVHTLLQHKRKDKTDMNKAGSNESAS